VYIRYNKSGNKIMAKRSERITAFVTVETKKALIEKADKEGRSLSNLAGTILDESVKEKK
jgi:uncharacterized protein (DUF1778 family)